MQKAIITLVMLGLSSVALADVAFNGSVGYRLQTTEAGTAAKTSTDRMKAELVASSKVNDKVNAVVGLRTGSVNSAYNDLGGNAGLKTVGLNLAYVEYAALSNVKVTLGKFNQPWATSSSLFFDRDVKPEGLAVAYTNKSGVFANASTLTINEGNATADTQVKSLQVGAKKDVLGYAVTGAVGLQDYAGTGATKYTVQNAFVSVGTKVIGKPVNVFVDTLKNTKASTDDTALSYGVKFGNAVNPREWDVAVVREKVEANSQYGLWNDSDFAGGQGNYKGTAVAGNYVVDKGWKLVGKYFDSDRGVSKEDFKRLQLDLTFSF